MTKREKIFDIFKKRSCTKQDVFENTADQFKKFKEVIKQIVDSYQEEVCALDERVKVEFESEGEYEARIRFGGDTLIFHMHSNVFSFDDSNYMWKTGYVEEDPLRAYCGVINIYNFLSDSFKFNRENDLGYLVSRVFINKENHFYVEGNKELNRLYRNFGEDVLGQEEIVNVVESSILYALNFELYTPPFKKVQLVSVSHMQQLSNNLKLRTGKRLGFKLNAERKINLK
ncbi:hypothetical protein [Salibacter sp.]|uniref:hypothetical protein n=1 Tax=Salibacter sp. TaxID=2010995 RepID=UPI0028704119|nr:hypothetical protein [Salibacter sp.]MDR9397526.1 hypothetical protein [Salibacter sp.]MDR9486942.1 hypothetical protein [Salibacter sp.]